MAEKYTTHNVLLESADFHVLLLQFPEEDINDKLCLLASEKGVLYRHLYEDFVIVTCMANSGPFFYHIRKRPELLTKFADIRREALALVYQYSPGFKPENIVINENNVMKTKGSVRKNEKARPLIENDLWNQEPPIYNFGPAIITNTPTKSKTDNPFRDPEEEENPLDILPEDIDPENPFLTNDGGDIDVPYELVGHKWEKIGLYVNVRKYEEAEGAVIDLLGGTPFESVRGYHLLIVERCIEDFADIFQILDSMGISQKEPNRPEVLMEDLYNIAIEHNPFLKLENLDIKAVRKEYKNRQKTKMRNNRRIAQGGSEDQVTPTQGRKKFSDLSKDDLLNLDRRIREKIVGQDEAVTHLTNAIQSASVGLKREHEPLGVFLLTGNTGSGKTQTAKVLAECLGTHLVKVDCQDYQQPHETAKLAGAPPGYVGHEDGGHLTKEVAKNPFSVVLFDEIEKAHSNFHERLLQILDEGIMADNKGKKISFKECIILMTSNIGVADVSAITKTVGFGDVSQQTDDKVAKARDEALKRQFKPEFLNRIDEIIHFRRLEKDDYLKILDVLLKEVTEQIKQSQGITLNLNSAAKDFILEQGVDKKYGARPLRRALKKHLNNPLARAVLSDSVKDNSRVNVGFDDDNKALTFKSARKQKKDDD